MIEYRTPAEVEQMRPAGRFVGEVLTALGDKADVGRDLRYGARSRALQEPSPPVEPRREECSVVGRGASNEGGPFR